MSTGIVKFVTGILALFIVIIAVVMIFWEVNEQLIETGTTDELFEGYTTYAAGAGTGSNLTGITISLDDQPASVADTNVTCINQSGSTVKKSYPTFTLNSNDLYIGANAASNFTEVWVNYTSQKTESAGESSDMFATITPMLVIIALVLVAGFMIAIITKFGE